MYETVNTNNYKNHIYITILDIYYYIFLHIDIVFLCKLIMPIAIFHGLQIYFYSMEF